MASSVLALTVATLLKGNAAAGDASAAEKGLIKSKSGRKSAAAETSSGTGDEKGDAIPAASVRKPSAAREGEGADSSALQAPATQRMSLLQRVLSRGKQRVVAPTTTAPAEADAVSVDGAGSDDVDADGPVADGSANGASRMVQQTSAALLSRRSNDASAVPAAEGVALDDVAPSGAADIVDDAAGVGGGDGTEAAAAVSACAPGADATLTPGDTAADAAPAGSACLGTDAGDDAPGQTPVRADREAARGLASQAALAAVPTAEAASRHAGAATVPGRDSVKAAPLVAPVQLATKQRPPPQQLTQRQPPPTVVAASAARLPPPRRVAAAVIAGQQQSGRSSTQVHHALPCGCLAPLLTFISMNTCERDYRRPYRQKQPSYPHLVDEPPSGCCCAACSGVN